MAGESTSGRADLRDGLPTPPKSFLQELSDRDLTFGDIFFWRDAPDWYHKTFLAAGMGCSYSVLRCYLNRHELEVFMPPRSAVLPPKLKQGYRNSQIMKYGFLKVGHETTSVAGIAAIYFGGAYYLGEYRGNHSWEHFAVSGAAASLGGAAWLLRPLHPRVAVFGTLLGAALGGGAAAATQALGLPLFQEGHDFEGWWLGRKIDLKAGKTAGADKATRVGS